MITGKDGSSLKRSSPFQNKTIFSFEVFPPKRTAPIETIYRTLDELQGLRPDFISVTFGAGGGQDSASTVEIASAIKHQYGIESVAHLPCINFTREQVLEQLGLFKANGIENILALRGDLVPGVAPKTDFAHASDLISFIRENGDFHLIGACYPEGHQESPDMISDIRSLKTKVDAGADHLISQLFFDNSHFYTFLERARLAGVEVPIEAGIMPVVNKKQIERMATLCGASLPRKFLRMMERFEHSPEAMRDAGIAYAVDQIVDLLSQGVDGVHLYTMNNSSIARRISEAVFSLFSQSNEPIALAV